MKAFLNFYLDRWWMPVGIFAAFVCIVKYAGCDIVNSTNDRICVLTMGCLAVCGMLASGFINLERKKWLPGLVNVIVPAIVTLIVVVPFIAFIVVCILMRLSESF